MKRLLEHHLVEWYRGEDRKPLVVRGARQVGKSTLVRMFAESMGLRLFEMNLERFTRLESVFARFDADEILGEIELVCNAGSLRSDKVLLFLDEIQAIPSAIPALRYIHEDRPSLPVIAAGSLLEFTLADHTFAMPVGRIDYLHMGPVTFFEFLQAQGLGNVLSVLGRWRPGDTLPVTAHEQACKHLRSYLALGGMPEAVDTHVRTGDRDLVQRVHQRVIDTFRDDFGKYTSGVALSRLQRVFDYLPTALGRKLKYSHVNPDWRAADVRDALDLLFKARVFIPAFHTSCAGIPIDGLRNEKVLKPYCLDIGLANGMTGVRGVDIDTFADARFVNEGVMAEQFIAQHLAFVHGPSARPSLLYWLRESRSNNAEVDFVVQLGTRVVPVEVKAGASGALKSLHRFAGEKRAGIAVRFDLSPPSVQKVRHRLTLREGEQVEFTLVSLPLYLVERLDEIVEAVDGGSTPG